MSLRRFYLPPEHCQGERLILGEREAHHARHVLRLRPGDRVLVLDGAGKEFACEVQESEREDVHLRVMEKRSFPPPPCRVTLVQAVPKGKLIEAIIEKATELGAWRIVPLLSERVVVRIEAAEAAHKAAKWQLAAIEAIKQCGSPWLPQIQAPLTPEQFLAQRQNCELSLVASLQPGSRHPREYFRAFQQTHARPPQTVSVWIGPEGDFTPAELQAIQAAGAAPITLGPRVLRAETAAIYCLSVLNYELLSARS